MAQAGRIASGVGIRHFFAWKLVRERLTHSRPAARMDTPNKPASHASPTPFSINWEGCMSGPIATARDSASSLWTPNRIVLHPGSAATARTPRAPAKNQHPYACPTRGVSGHAQTCAGVLEQAALSRTDLTPAQRRRPYTVLVDEWPSFAAQDDTIGTILSQTRKFNLRLYLAAQSTCQITSERLNGALENCRLNVVFGLGRDSAVHQSRHIGWVDPMVLKEAPLTSVQHGRLPGGHLKLKAKVEMLFSYDHLPPGISGMGG